MKNLIKKMSFIFLILATNFAFGENMSREQIVEVLNSDNSMKKKVVKKMISGLEKAFGTDEYGNLKIKGVISSKTTFSGQAFYDFRPKRNFNLHIINSKTGKMIKLKKVVHGKIRQDGVKVGFGASKSFIFLASGQNLQDLEGQEFGGIVGKRGLSTSAPFLLFEGLVGSLTMGVSFFATMWFDSDMGVLRSNDYNSQGERPVLAYLTLSLGIPLLKTLVAFPKISFEKIDWDKIPLDLL